MTNEPTPEKEPIVAQGHVQLRANGEAGRLSNVPAVFPRTDGKIVRQCDKGARRSRANRTLSEIYLPLRTVADVRGYYLDDIQTELSSDPRLLRRFQKWINGQTMMLDGDKVLVYKWDWDDFVAGRRPTD